MLTNESKHAAAEIQSCSINRLSDVISEAVRHANNQLYTHISTVEDWLQEDYSITINLLDANNDWLSSRVSDRINKQLDELFHGQDNEQPASGLAGVDVSKLSLVSKDEFEDWLNVNKSIKTLHRELEHELMDLTQVFSAVFDEVVNTDDIPLAPHKLLSEVKYCIDELQLPATPQGFLYKVLAASLKQSLSEFYKEIKSLAEKQSLVLKPKASRPSSNNAEAEALVVPEQKKTTPPTLNLEEEAEVENLGLDAELGLAEERSESSGLNTLSALSRLNATISSGASLGARPSGKVKLAQAVSKSAKGVAAGQGVALAGKRLLSLISELQKSDAEPEVERGGKSLRSYIEQGIPGFDAAAGGIAQQESELIDVTDRFFNVIVNKIGVNDVLQNWLQKLKLTILKIVLRDESFFSDAGHPARQLLNKLARLASSEGGGNRRLQSLLDQYIDRVVAEYDDNEATVDEVVSKLNELIERQEKAYKRNSERIARSYEDKQKIADARHQVVADLGRLLSNQSVPLVLMELLDKAGWREYMAGTIIREGKKSHAYSEVLNVVDQLMSWFGSDVDNIDKWAVELEMELEAPSLYEMVERELQALAKPEAKSVLKVLHDCLFMDAKPIHVKIKEYDWPFEKHERDLEALQPQEAERDDFTHWHKRIVAMKIGDWVEMKADDGRIRCLRLAWSGRESFRFVFVDSQGMKDEDVSLEDLVARFKTGEASFIASEQVPLVDQGLHQMVQSVYEELSSQASCDVLTGLLNRQAFERALKQSVAAALTYRNEAFLLYFDLDKFNVTNTNYGHVAGDAILRRVADTIREHSPEDGFCGRLGGNEFGLILSNSTSNRAKEIGELVRLSISENPCVWEGHNITSTISAGLVPIDLETDNYDSVMRKAILACSAAKSAGHNRLVEYQAQDKDQQKRDEMLHWVQRLDGSLDDMLVLRCQEIRPTGSSDDERSHWEVLLGVKQDGQVLPPAILIEAAEHFDRMSRIDRWVVHHVLEWMEDNAAFVENSSGFSINLSGNSLSDDTFLEFVLGELSACAVDPTKICFEITETAAITNLADASEFIRVLKQKGCTFSLDDFGSGLSSYAYIQKLPVDYIKIDGIFIRNLVQSQNDQALVRSINELAHFMGIETVAEFVENEEILRVLRQIGVDHSQGYGIKKPLLLENLS